MARNPLSRAFFWCVPTAAILTFLWFRRKKLAAKSDPGGASCNSDCEEEESLKDLIIYGGRRVKTVTPNIAATVVDSLYLPPVPQSQGLEENSQVENSDTVNYQLDEREENSFTGSYVMEETSVSDYCRETDKHCEMEDDLKFMAVDSSSLPPVLEKVDDKSGKKVNTEELSVMDVMDIITTGREKNVDTEELTVMDMMDSFTTGCEKNVNTEELALMDAMDSTTTGPEENVKTEEPAVTDPMDSLTTGLSCVNLMENNNGDSTETFFKKREGFLTENEASASCQQISSPSSMVVVCVSEVPQESDAKKETLVKGEVEGACGGISSDAVSVPVAERDSANHSPADVMLNSPAISPFSDHHSEGSSDSGKGCSYMASPPSRTPASCSSLSGDHSAHVVYEFLLPQQLVGRLIGRHGTYVHQVKSTTRANIFIKRHPVVNDIKICAVEGSRADIEAALKMIREKFPERRYPNVTLEQVSFVPPPPTVPLAPEFSHLQLVESVNNDVVISTLVSPSHFFLQQPTHPTYLALNQLNACMTMVYSESNAPMLPSVEAGTICAVPSVNGWYRAQIVAVNDEEETCDVKFVDYGGYGNVLKSNIRQIRSDFMTLPFQAAECYLAHVTPAGGVPDWSAEATDYVAALSQNQVLQAQVCGYADDGLPVVYLFARHGPKVIPIHQELVAQGLAEWWEPSES